MEKPELIGILDDMNMQTMTQRTMLRINLQKQQKEAEEQITVLETSKDKRIFSKNRGRNRCTR